MTQEMFNRFSIVQNQKSGRRIVFFLLLWLSVMPAAADWRDDINTQLSQRWISLTGNQDEHSVSFIGISDDYLLPACQHAVDWQLVKALQPGRNGIQLSCSSPYWRQHIAIQFRVIQPVVVLSHASRGGQPLQSSQVRISRMDIGQLSKGFYRTPSEVIGLLSKRALPPGTVLSPDMLELPILVKRGQAVAIRLQRPGIEVEMDGTAMGSGHQGERIRVRNNQSGKIISAVIIARGLVQVK